MKVKVFAIWDDAAKAYMQPFTRNTTGLAIRDFTGMVNDPQTIVNRHPASFVLFQLGTFDDNTGELSPGQEMVISAMQVKETASNVQQELLK